MKPEVVVVVVVGLSEMAGFRVELVLSRFLVMSRGGVDCYLFSIGCCCCCFGGDFCVAVDFADFAMSFKLGRRGGNGPVRLVCFN